MGISQLGGSEEYSVMVVFFICFVFVFYRKTGGPHRGGKHSRALFESSEIQSDWGFLMPCSRQSICLPNS